MAMARSLRPANITGWMISRDAKLVGQRLRKRFLAGSAGEEQGAVDVEEADVHGGQESRVGEWRAESWR